MSEIDELLQWPIVPVRGHPAQAHFEAATGKDDAQQIELWGDTLPPDSYKEQAGLWFVYVFIDSRTHMPTETLTEDGRRLYEKHRQGPPEERLDLYLGVTHRSGRRTAIVFGAGVLLELRVEGA